MKKYILSFLVFSLSCDISSSKPINNPDPVLSIDNQDYKNMSKAYFASGCFWCVETIYESLDGVKEVYSGYAGGSTINPNYYQVMSGKTGHAEAIEIIYDENVVSFDTLLKVFFDSHNPTTPNRQGPDYGTQYRSIAFYTSDVEKQAIMKIIANLNKEKYQGNIVTEVTRLKKFYKAEAYHQNFEKRNPNQEYVRAVSIPRLQKFKRKFPKLLKKYR